MRKVTAGVDEVGRGCIAGPVVAAAVILGKKPISDLRDSKLLSPKKRFLLSEEIKKNCIEYSIAEISAKDIDKLNIKRASLLAMKKAVEGLKKKNIEIIVDGIDKIENTLSGAGVLKNNNFYDPANLHVVHHVNQALKANFIFKKDKDYVLVDNKFKIIDEISGRILEERRYADVLHKAIQAKETVKIKIVRKSVV